ncbi:hypothetical protein I302_108909 [Kwoniella bestiolae CBS 10118]|uniref:Uncharacterized protein n=1 Tax=Kwoniella bestiolae CBS 10118 TaxID=1296100 RepID=A0A1B9FUE6_9TREE|nr:hypothetical protein I302_08047 [Kwoniella bestiolae CBS 10118]OCF22399.1 hypothetical protein I302_08047 [Kwoniella bestiolae CBS 10118]
MREGDFSSSNPLDEFALRDTVMRPNSLVQAQNHNQPMPSENDTKDQPAHEDDFTADVPCLRGASAAAFGKFMDPELSRDKPKSKLTRKAVSQVFTSCIRSAGIQGAALFDADDVRYKPHLNAKMGHWQRSLELIVDDDLAKEVCGSDFGKLPDTLEYTDLKPGFDKPKKRNSRVIYDIWKKGNPHTYLGGGQYQFDEDKDLYTLEPISCTCTLYWNFNGKRGYEQRVPMQLTAEFQADGAVRALSNDVDCSTQ